MTACHDRAVEMRAEPIISDVPMRAEPSLGAMAIRPAVDRLPVAFRRSPQYVHDGLSRRAGRPVIVKVETVNPIGAFKGRGTWLLVADLVGEGRLGPSMPIVVASTGNFGQGVAFAARAHDVPAVVFANEQANSTKLDRIRAFGATVVQKGHDFDAAREAAEAYARSNGGLIVIDGREAVIATGAATLALEVTDAIAAGELPPIATAFVPVGNGSLIIGVASWLRAAAVGCRVIGVQSEAAPSMTLSWRSGRPIETDSAATFADGIATRVPVPEALDLMRSRVDDMILVSEAAIHDAQTELTAALGITVEGAAAASWAGLLATPGDGPALVIVTGSNVVGS
jgi:threonine dehydratase